MKGAGLELGLLQRVVGIVEPQMIRWQVGSWGEASSSP